MNPDPAYAVQVYWNLENCPVDDDYKKVRDVESCIENSLKLADRKFHITKKVVVGNRYHDKFFRDNFEAFQEAGWSVETTPERELICCAYPNCDQQHQHVLKTNPPAHQRQKVADRMLIQYITRNIMAEGEKPKYILLITGDSNFALTIELLKESGVTVLLAVGSDAKADFKTKALHTWLFSEMMSTQAAAPPLVLRR